MTLLDHCPVCESDSVEEFLRRDSVPVHQNLLLESAVAAKNLRRGDLAMTVCRDCGFVFNAAFDPKRLDYGSAYENTQTHSPAFADYVNDLVEHLVRERDVKNCRIVEIGCGKGGFLTKLVEPPEHGNQGFGYDPSYLGPETLYDGRLEFRRQFYDARCRDLQADAVICRHVIEHIESPVSLLRAVQGALQDSPRAKIFFETPCVDWILQHQVVWDFFYEHCSLFTPRSLTTAFERAGLAVVGCRHVFGGQYLWLEAQPAAGPTPVRRDAGATCHLARRFAIEESRRQTEWMDLLAASRRRGPVALWGAGAKGVTFANLLDPRGELMDCVVDVNPAKQGKFLAGTGHPIVRPEDLLARRVQSVIVLNPNYVAEVRQWLIETAPRMEVIDLMERKRAA
ncbi:MAG: class I SAM-dependent methyltransferase [Planctomycetaceae bacterium]